MEDFFALFSLSSINKRRLGMDLNLEAHGG
jgi:hypothetical protein